VEIIEAASGVGAAMKSKLLAIWTALALFTSLSCGDSGDNGSGVAGDKLVKDVTGADVEKVCRWNNDQLLSLIKGVSVRQACTYDLAPVSSSKAECRAEVDDCVAQAGEDEEEDDLEDEDVCEDAELPDLAAGCYAITVADYESCVKSLIRASKQVISEASCDAPGEELEEEEEDAADELPADCKTILQRCPSILPDVLNPNSGGETGFEEQDFEDL
jgi:hypothetical protein